MANSIRYLVFDIESVADARLVAKLRYAGESLEPAEAVRRYRAELMEKYDNDFIPYTFQVPISVAVAKVSADFRLADLVVLDEPRYRPHVITENFWRGWERYHRPTLVSFNGRGFDLPLLELAAFRYGLSLPGWFSASARAAEQPRNRYNVAAHTDLCELLTNFGGTRFNGGLSLAANLLGKPGKMDVHGDMVQDLYDAGRLEEIHDYCRCDVPGHLLRFPPQPGADRPACVGNRAANHRRDQDLARAKGPPGGRLPALSGALGRLAQPLAGRGR